MKEKSRGLFARERRELHGTTGRARDGMSRLRPTGPGAPVSLCGGKDGAEAAASLC
jgi:alkanesulfonate monooxygenase SsuD/methylene tetrahydromethanopterin reductase-like flavin-dependent oxidoreductase (luciferase family)